MRKRFITPAFLVITVLCSHIANAALIRVSDGATVSDLASESTTVWDIVNDKLNGAFNVNVDGTLWDVRFTEGIFGSVFPDSNVPEERISSEADAFSFALADLVLLDSNGRTFNSSSDAILGCESILECNILTPWGANPDVYPVVRVWVNGYNDLDSSFADRGIGVAMRYDDTTGDAVRVWAVWERKDVVDVPAPATILILALGLIGIEARRFKKQS